MVEFDGGASHGLVIKLDREGCFDPKSGKIGDMYL